jgi:hypothetical protein
MKAISLWQPWASLMAIGAKRIETRHWYTHQRGLVAIHAAKRWTREEQSLIEHNGTFFAALERHGIDHLSHFPLPLGAIVAVGELIDCKQITTKANLDECDAVAGDGSFTLWAEGEKFLKTHILPPPEPERSFGNYEPGRYAWIFENVRAIEPIPCKGKQGWFDVDISRGEREIWRSS